MHGSALQQRGHAVPKRAQDEDIECSGVVHLGEVCPGVQHDGGKGEDGGDAWEGNDGEWSMIISLL